MRVKILALKDKIEEGGHLREVLQQKLLQKKDEAACHRLMQDVTSKNYITLDDMNSSEHRLMVLDHEFALDSRSEKSFSEQKYERLLQANNRLKSEFTQNLKTLVTYKPCRRCERQYLPIQNSGNSCKYHPGNKKYFSCKNCGKDVYYTCCNWCDECIEGCTLTYHV